MSGVKIDDQIRKLVKAAEDADWSVTVTRNSRLKWTDPQGVQVAVSPMQCGSSRVLPNLKAQLRGGGLALPEDENHRGRQVVLAETVEVDLPIEAITPTEALEALMDYVTNQESKDWEETNADFARMQAELKRKEEEIGQLRAEAKNAGVLIERKDQLISEIRKAFTMKSWEVMPAIARLVGIEMGS